jgi:hypothetical protein
MMLVVVLASSAALAQQPTGDGSPIALHLGPAFTRVADADFEVVGSLSGQDLFAQTDVRDSTVDFGVFVSQRLWGTNGDPARLYATLGSGISRPGRLLFLGGSIAAARAFLTVGLATALVDAGVQPVPDAVFPSTQTRTLFGGLSRTRQWGVFLAASFAVLQ